MRLPELLVARRGEILDRAVAALERAHLAHYAAAGAPARRERLARLFDLAAAAIADRRLTEVLLHAETVARERFSAGFDLIEVQVAYNVLEEEIWRAAIGELPAAELPEALGLVATVLGAGKDRLAATYVELASRTRTPSLDLRALFAGVASGAAE
jgi:hypothetical protein